MSEIDLWYTARGTGVAMLSVFTAALVLGVLTRGGRSLPGLPRFAVAGLHRNLALLGLTFLAVHVTTVVLDPYSRVGVLAVLVPFTAHYRPLWVGLGTVALDLFLAVAVTSLLRHRLGRRSWKAVHLLAYAAWPVALLHGAFSGTDNTTGWMLLVDAVAAAAVLTAVGWRLAGSPRWRHAVARSA